MKDKAVYKISEFSEKTGVAPSTLRRWDRDGTLKAGRSLKGQRVYTQEQYEKYMEDIKKSQ